VLALVVVLSSLLCGCRSPEPRSPEVVRQKALEPPEPSIFDRLSLDAGQRATLRDSLSRVRQELAVYDQARLELLDAIVVGIRAGTFDRARLEPLIERTIVEYERATPHLMRFANQVHAVLSPPQRKELVLLWDDDERELSDEERQAKEEEELTRVLDLTGSQKTRLVTPLLGIYLQYYGPIGDARKAWAEAKSAFQGDTFDAARLRLFTALPLRTLARAIFDASETVLSVLEPNQRETLAVTIESGWRD